MLQIGKFDQANVVFQHRAAALENDAVDAVDEVQTINAASGLHDFQLPQAQSQFFCDALRREHARTAAAGFIDQRLIFIGAVFDFGGYQNACGCADGF